jgi:adenine/guanine phosphoribosyltransferase-like PRPP-binding protein
VFLLSSVVTCDLNKGPAPIRKGGKLPNTKRNMVSQRFSDNSGADGKFEISKTLVSPRDRVLLLDNWA